MIDPGLFLHAVGDSPNNIESSEREREQRIDRHRHLCARAARRFVRDGLERSDLEQVAAIGLIKAADRYRVSMQTPFEAYAWTLVLGELLHFVRDHERLVRVPREIARRERATFEAVERLRSRLQREPNDREVADETGLTRDAVHEALLARESLRPLSLESFDGGLDARCERELAARAPGLEPADRVAVAVAIDRLNPLARNIVLGLHVLGYKRAELAQRLGFSARRVARINELALAMLADAMTVAA